MQMSGDEDYLGQSSGAIEKSPKPIESRLQASERAFCCLNEAHFRRRLLPVIFQTTTTASNKYQASLSLLAS